MGFRGVLKTCRGLVRLVIVRALALFGFGARVRSNRIDGGNGFGNRSFRRTRESRGLRYIMIVAVVTRRIVMRGRTMSVLVAVLLLAVVMMIGAGFMVIRAV